MPTTEPLDQSPPAPTRVSRRSPARVGAACLTVLALGGALFTAGWCSAPGGPSAEADLALAAVEPADRPGQAGAGRSAEIPQDASAAALGFGLSATTFTAGTLPAGTATTAPGWAYDPSTSFTAATAAKLAAALNVAGDPTQEWRSWRVGPPDYSSATLTLNADSSTTFSYYDPTSEVPWCATDTIVEPAPALEGGPDSLTSSTAAAPAPGCDPGTGPGTLPTAENARSELEALLADLDVPTDGWVRTDDVVESEQYLTVGFGPAAGADQAYAPGGWTATFTPLGLLSVGGSLAPLVELGQLDIIDAHGAVERLNDPKFANSGDQMHASDAQYVPADDDALPATLKAGEQISWPVREVVITSWKLTTSTQTTPTGLIALLPTYLLTSDDGTTWSVLAVADKHLNFTS